MTITLRLLSPAQLEEDLNSIGFPTDTYRTVVNGERMSEAYKLARDGAQLLFNSKKMLQELIDTIKRLDDLRDYLGQSAVVDSDNPEVCYHFKIIISPWEANKMES